jgi:hypothetical protein
MLNKLGPINRRTILGLLLIASLLLLVLGLTWVLTNSSAEDSWTFVQGEEQVGILEYANSEQISRTSWFVLVSGGLALAVGLYVGSQRPSSFSNEHQSPSPRIRLRQLILFSGISLALYALHFLLPFPLHRFYNFRRVSLGWITLREPVMAIGISVGIVTLFLVYIFAYRLCRGKNARRLWAVVLFGALIFSLLNFFVFPLTSTDVYDYVARGRITGVHEGNPYTDVPNDYPGDPYVQMAAWRKNTTVYGPLWEVLSGLIGRFAGDSLWANVLAYKGLAWMGYLLSTILVASILRRISPARALSGTILFAWNPLVLMEGVANLHNDMLMIALLLGGIWALSRVREEWRAVGATVGGGQKLIFGLMGMILLTASILIKFIPLLFLPFIFLYLLSTIDGNRRKIGIGLLLIVPILLLSFYYFRIFWEWPQITAAFIRRIEMFRMSLSSLTKEVLQVFLRADVARFLGSWPYLAVFAGGYAIVFVRAFVTLWQPRSPRWVGSRVLQSRLVKAIGRFVIGPEKRVPGRSWEVLIAACLKVLLLYLLFGNPWFWPWYLIWPIAVLALYADENMVILLTVVACAGQLSHVLWNFVWYWLGTSWQNLYIVDIIAVGLILIPAVLVYLALRQRSKVPLMYEIANSGGLNRGP